MVGAGLLGGVLGVLGAGVLGAGVGSGFASSSQRSLSWSLIAALTASRKSGKSASNSSVIDCSVRLSAMREWSQLSIRPSRWKSAYTRRTILRLRSASLRSASSISSGVGVGEGVGVASGVGVSVGAAGYLRPGARCGHRGREHDQDCGKPRAHRPRG